MRSRVSQNLFLSVGHVIGVVIQRGFLVGQEVLRVGQEELRVGQEVVLVQFD